MQRRPNMDQIKTRLIPDSERTASPGKFRLVILIDGDFHQVEDDFGEFEEAFKFGSDRVKKGEFLAVYNDKGVAVDPNLYRAGFYKLWNTEEILVHAEPSIRSLRDAQVVKIRNGHHISARQLGIVLQLAEAELSRIKEKK